MDNILLSARSVSSCYNGREVLHKVSADFGGGRISVIIGPNGSGKSTLLKTLIGIVPKKEGEIFSEGRNTDNMSSLEIARRIAYLPQIKSIPDITVRTMVLHGRFSHLSYPRRYRKEDVEIVERAMEITGVSEYADKNVSALSGGMIQLVFLAMALAQSSQAILMDEPTTFLDISHQVNLMRLCRKLADEGKAVIAVLHDIPLALKYADDIIVISDGKAVMSDTASNVYKSGVLNSVFNIEIKKAVTETGVIYYCE